MPELNPQMAKILELMEEAMKDRPLRVTLSPVEARAQTNATFEAFWNADRPTLWAFTTTRFQARAGRSGSACTIRASRGRRRAWSMSTAAVG